MSSRAILFRSVHPFLWNSLHPPETGRQAERDRQESDLELDVQYDPDTGRRQENPKKEEPTHTLWRRVWSGGNRLLYSQGNVNCGSD